MLFSGEKVLWSQELSFQKRTLYLVGTVDLNLPFLTVYS